MREIKIFTMQKNESDILEKWILYHSKITDISNIYIIDNNSTDNSILILEKYKDKGLNIFTKDDYKQKGRYIYELIKKYSSNNDIVIPLDIDEFIGYIDIIEHNVDLSLDDINILQYIIKNKYTIEQIDKFFKENKNIGNTSYITSKNKLITILKSDPIYMSILGYLNPNKFIITDPILIRKYILNLPEHDRYCFNYYFTSINTKLYYNDPINDIVDFELVNIFNNNKKFFTSDKLRDLDHGNHYGITKNNNNTIRTNLFLFHYHFRGLIKLIDKCRNDIRGLNKIKDIDNIESLKYGIKNNIMGSHNVAEYLKFVENGIYNYNICYKEYRENNNIYKIENKIII
jgi:hypothetical protein